MSSRFTIHHNESADVEYYVMDERDIFVPLPEVEGRPADSALAQMQKNVAFKAAIQTSLNKKTWHKGLAEAAGHSSILRSERDVAQEKLQEAKTDLNQTRNIHYPLLLLTAIAVIVALFAEVGLTWSVLPSFLNVPARSFLGYALGGITLVLTVALEQLFDPVLLALEGHLRGSARGYVRFMAVCAAAVLTSVVIALNGIVLVKLGLAREEAAKLLEILSNMAANTEMPRLNTEVSGSMVVWVGAVTVLDSALAVRQLMRGLQNCFLRRAAARRVANGLREAERLQRELALAEVKESCKRQWFADADLHATMLAGAAESRDLALIEEIRDRKIPRPKADLATLVDKVLSPGQYPANIDNLDTPWPEGRTSNVQ